MPNPCAKEIPAPAPPEHPEHLGVNLGRTMALLESGKYTHRPVRIVFSGQSIESEWTRLLIQRLRERYPGTTIVAENRAIGGWFVFRMQKLIKHDILRWQPDLVLFSFHGTRPQNRTMDSGAPNIPMTYHTGANMQAETWLLTLTDGNADADEKKGQPACEVPMSDYVLPGRFEQSYGTLPQFNRQGVDENEGVESSHSYFGRFPHGVGGPCV
jgi:hypothetical protein